MILFSNFTVKKSLFAFFAMTFLILSVNLVFANVSQECDNPRCNLARAQSTNDPSYCENLRDNQSRQECLNRINENNQRQRWIESDVNRALNDEEFQQLSDQISNESDTRFNDNQDSFTFLSRSTIIAILSTTIIVLGLGTFYFKRKGRI